MYFDCVYHTMQALSFVVAKIQSVFKFQVLVDKEELLHHIYLIAYHSSNSTDF